MTALVSRKPRKGASVRRASVGSRRQDALSQLDLAAWSKFAERIDLPLLLLSIALLCLGLVMVASTSVAIADSPLYYFKRQATFALLGAAAAALMLTVPLSIWERLGWPVLAAGLFLLVATLVPGVGKEVNGSMRWIPLGVFNLQVSEVARLCLVIYLAGYLVRRADAMHEGISGVLAPTLILAAAGVLLLLQPDLGALVMLAATWMVMLFIGNVRWRWIMLLVGAAGLAIVLLVVFEPYRMERLLAFNDPWADPYGRGYQPVQALIAIGRGGWFGVGLGQSMQKLFYLPEAHTDFVFAVYAEEAGLIGVIAMIAMIAWFVQRVFAIAAESARLDRWFAAYLCFGVGAWIGIQSIVHIAVNLGRLPPKGLTLPLISYGGSSLLVAMICIGLVLRASYENRNGPILKRKSRARKKAAGGRR